MVNFKSLLPATAAVSLLFGAAGSANAAVVITSSVFGTTAMLTAPPGSVVGAPNDPYAPDFTATSVITFDTGPVFSAPVAVGAGTNIQGFTFSGDGAVVGPPSQSGQYASPAHDTTRYLTTEYTSGSANRSTTLTLGATYNHFGLY